MSITLPAFTPAQESLFLTLGGRALDSRLPRPFLGDALADEIITTLGYDLAKFPTLSTKLLDAKSRVFDIAVRAKRIDEIVCGFVVRHPDAVVLDLGAGLDSRMFRVDPPPTVDWYDIDFPEVIALRPQLLPQPANVHNIGTDLADPNWLDNVPTGRPTVIVADGLVAFVAQDDFVSLLNRLVSHLPSGELAFNLYTPSAIWTLKHTSGMAAIAGGVVNPGFNDPRQPESWVSGLKLVEEIFLTRAPEVDELPLILRLTSRLAAPSATVSRQIGTTVLRYRFC
jgi:O-methyltransferase involved in polyketide biosynthesis